MIAMKGYCSTAVQIAFQILRLILVSSCQLLDNKTLIYHHDQYHNKDWICKFATEQEIQTYSESVEIQCFKANKEMTYIMPDGTETYPYFLTSSEHGFHLKCGRITHGKVNHCWGGVYDSCEPRCDKGFKPRNVTITCDLFGPWKNVSVKWSDAETCVPVINTNATVIQQSDPEKTTISGQKTPYSLWIALPVGAIIVFAICIGGIVFWRAKKKKLESSGTGGSSDFQEEQIPLNPTGPLNPSVPGPSTPKEDGGLQEENIAVNLTPGTGDFQEEQIPLNPTGPLNPSVPGPSTPKEDGGLQEENIAVNLTPGTGFPDLAKDYAQTSLNIPDDERQQNKGINQVAKNDIPFWNFCKTPGTKETVMDFVGPTELDCKVRAEPDLNQQYLKCGTSMGKLQKLFEKNKVNLRINLEYFSSKPKNHSLAGFMQDTRRLNEGHINLIEKKHEKMMSPSATDEYISQLAAGNVMIGEVVKYFFEHGARDAVNALLDAHKISSGHCQYCHSFQ